MPTNHARQRPLHSRNHDNCIRRTELFELLVESMGAGNADILHQCGLDTHPVERLAGFFRNGPITGTRSDDRDASASLNVLSRDANGARDWVIGRLRKSRPQIFGFSCLDPRGQNGTAMLQQLLENSFQDLRRLAFPKDNLRITTTAAAIEIDDRIPQVGRGAG